jgi:hypothetical protein
MRFRRFAPAAAIAVALGATAATVAAAETCYAPTALCALFGAKEAEPTPPTPPTEAETPPKLEAAQRKPAAAAGTRTAKEGQARANRSTVKHHSKRRLAKVQPEPAVMRNLAPEAYALDTAALVRVVEPDEFNEIDRAAAPSDESRIAYAAEPKRESAQVDSVDQSNARLAVSLDMLARKLATTPRPQPQPQVQVQAQPAPQPEPETWLQWALSRLTRVYVSASAAVRTLLG